MNRRRSQKSHDSTSSEHRNRTRQFGRRQFLRITGGAGLALAASGPAASTDSTPALATRVLGRTGEKVTVLGLGTAPVGEGPVGVEEGIRIFGEVLDRGVTYVDTARVYGDAEEILGHLVPTRSDNLFLVTKVSGRTAARAERSLGESLRTLRTDMIDLVHIHSVGNKDPDQLTAKDGVLEYLLKQKEAGKIRFIGVSAHNRPSRVVRMIETDQIDVVMCVMNYADRHTYDFERKVIPEARKRNVGCVAMKVYAGIKGGFPNHNRGYVGCVTEPDRMPHALSYALDLDGVSVAVVGPYTVDQAIQNVELARKYTPLTEQQRAALMAHGKKLAPTLGARYGPVA